MTFKSVMLTPPGGEYFFEHEGERVSARHWLEFLPKLKDVMARHGIKGTPLDVAAAHMCPHMPSWFCTSGGVRDFPVATARAEARQYFSKQVVTPSEIARRLEVCRTCPKHSRTVCLTCTGIASWILSSFGGRRPSLPDDKMSGICRCANTFEMAAASVDARGLPKWDDVPDCCWRNKP